MEKTVAIYPGRFQPFGPHHYEAYKLLANKFGVEDTYIATSDKTDPERSPFTFEEKKQIAMSYGIPGDKIVQVRSPYQPKEVLDLYQEDTPAIFLLGEKDATRLQTGKMKKDGTPGYFAEYNPNMGELEGWPNRGYVIIAPNISKNIPGVGEMSGTNIRQAIRSGIPMGDIFGDLDVRTLDMIQKKFQPQDLNEGRYDAISNKISSDIFRYWKDNVEDGEITFKGTYQHESEDINVEATLEVTPEVEYLEVDGGADDKTDFIAAFFKVNPSKLPKYWSEISFNLKDVIRHEIEHLTHGDSSHLKFSKYMKNDELIRQSIDAGLLSGYRYFELEKEIDANLQGMYFRAKKEKRPFKDIINTYLDAQDITAEEKEGILNLWRKRNNALNLPLFENEELLNEVDLKKYVDKAKEGFSEFIAALKQEGKETKDAYKLLAQSVRGKKQLSKEEKKEIGNQLKDVFKTIGYVGLFALPGGSIFTILFTLLKLNKYVLPSSFQKNNLKEEVVGDKIVCNALKFDGGYKRCNWSWDIEDGGDDLYMCHKCGHNNEPLNEAVGDKTLYAFDLDDTLITSKSNIIVTNPKRGTFQLTPAEYALYTPGPDDELDFSEFASLNEPKIIPEMFNLFSQILTKTSKLPNAKTIILTARQPEVISDVKEFLSNKGLADLKVHAVGSSDPMEKVKVILDYIEDGYKKIRFYDDSPKNVRAVKTLNKTTDAEVKSQLISLHEMLFEFSGGAIMNKQETGRHKKKLAKLRKHMEKQGSHMVPYPDLPKTVFGGIKLYEGFTDEEQKHWAFHYDLFKKLNDAGKKYEELYIRLSNVFKNKPKRRKALEYFKNFIQSSEKIDEMYPPYKANMVQKTRYKASDVWTNDPNIKEGVSNFRELYSASPPELQQIVMDQKKAQQNPEWHPEGNVLKHIITVTNRAIKSYPDNMDIILAAYFHDLGKLATSGVNPKTGHPTAYGHEKVSAELVRKYSEFISKMGANPENVEYLVASHMKIKPRTWDVMKQSKKDKMQQHSSFDDLGSFTKIDRGGLDLEETKLFSKDWWVDILQESIIEEGGNIFKDKLNGSLTTRINKADVDPTLKWLETIINLDLINNKLGSTGIKDTSGDLDIAINQEETTKDELVNKLSKWVEQNHPEDDIKQWVRKSGISVHFKTPIKGNESNGYVQTDLMFGNPEWMKFSLRGTGDNTIFKGVHRLILMASIAKSKGLKYSTSQGLTKRDTGKFLTKDPDKIAKILLGTNAGVNDLNSVETIFDKIKFESNYNELVSDAIDNFHFKSIKPEDNILLKSIEEVNLLQEGARIDHAEDIVFWEGSKGALRAVDALRNLEKGGHKEVTIKWDGSPAIIFGRDENGDFILTDKNGYVAKGYDGKTKSADDLEKMLLSRGKEVTDSRRQFAGSMKSIFDEYEKAVPQDYRGLFKGDLLYYNTPPVKDKNFIFKPNIVQYAVDVDSDLGNKIGKSKTGVVIHRQVDAEGNESSLRDPDIFLGDEVLVVPPITAEKAPDVPNEELNRLEDIVKKDANDIDTLLNQDTLRKLQISDFSKILYAYTNSKVDTGLDNLGKDFEKWLAGSKVSQRKQGKITEYITQNPKAFESLWEVVGGIMQAKDHIIDQLDKQGSNVKQSIGGQEGGEGYVLAHPGGDIKLVPRATFSKANRAVQRT